MSVSNNTDDFGDVSAIRPDVVERLWNALA